MVGARTPALVVLLLSLGSIALEAQTSFHATLGARYSSTLVHDSIVTPLDVRADVGPMLTGSVALPLSGPWRLELLTGLSTSALRRHDAGGATATISRLWILGVAVGLRRQLEPWLQGRMAVGGLKYLPSGTVGLFSAGSGVIPYGSVDFDAAPAVLARRRLAVEVGADLHRFLTPALRSAGFTDARVVYRINAGLRVDLRRAQP
jgi:hypothetical protein